MQSRSMSALSACLLCGLALWGGQVEADGRQLQASAVAGGRSVKSPEPFMASLRYGKEHFCGGTLVAPNVVLTAAHCLVVKKTPPVHIARFSRRGKDKYGFEKFQTIRSIVHPEYNRKSLDKDIALLVLDSQSLKKPVELESSDSCFESKGGCKVRVLGWGDSSTSSGAQLADVLQEGTTRSVSRSTCKAQLGASRITSAMICAGEPKGGIDSCQGDSGGPMLLSKKQVGVVSWGIGCAEAGNPGVYTSIPELLGWIQGELKKIVQSSSSDSEDTVGSPSLDYCDCADDGVSGGVSTNRFGCKQHLWHKGDRERFCMVKGGLSCPSATASTVFPGATWKLCG